MRSSGTNVPSEQMSPPSYKNKNRVILEIAYLRVLIHIMYNILKLLCVDRMSASFMPLNSRQTYQDINAFFEWQWVRSHFWLSLYGTGYDV